MSRRIRSVLRATFAVTILLSVVAVGYSYAETTGIDVAAGADTQQQEPTDTSANATSTAERAGERSEAGTGDGTNPDVERRFAEARATGMRESDWSTQRVSAAVADSERGLTVVATQGFYVSDERAEIAAFLPNGTLVYYNDTYRVYFDVDPVPDERFTVEYVAAAHLDGEVCEDLPYEQCTRNVVNRVNLTTGEHERVYAEVTPRIYSARWHDVDRINETHLLVADIVNDGVYAVDTRDGEVEWRWNATAHYNESQGGQTGDWTHINDVELLDDGNVMVSPRNMDEVIFIEDGPDGWAVNESRTLGTDDNHDVLYEQHNPDYIPRALGGPSVIVADSENGRIVEYNRTESGWKRTWRWRDVRLQWPRDADRLPNGNTLVVDSHGDRVVEVGTDDIVAWSADVGMPYDVERLGTGDESAGGPAVPYRDAPVNPSENGSTAVGNVTNATLNGDEAGPSRSVIDRFWLTLKDLVPSLVANGLLYVAPSWVRFSDLAFAAAVVATGVVWTVTEFHWSRYSLRGFGRWTRRFADRVAERVTDR